METIHDVMAWVAFGLECMAVLVIVIAIVVATIRYGLFRSLFQLEQSSVAPRYKRQVGSGLLLGMDLLVAADIIQTVLLDSTLHNVAVLGLLVLIRVVLTWSLVLEVDGWLPRRGGAHGGNPPGNP